MLNTFNDIESPQRQSFALGLSVVLHAMVLFLMLFNFSWADNDFEKSPPAILMVDLTKVQLADKTNLPPEVKKQKKKETPKPVVKKEKLKEKPKAKPQPKKEQTKTPVVKKEPPKAKPETVKPTPKPKQKEAVKVAPEKKPEQKKQPKKEVKKETPKKATPKPQPKTQPKKAPQKAPQQDGLKSLLASVEKVKKPANPAPTEEIETEEESGLEINEGIKGGTEGSRLEALTISEKDLIANKIRQCWNVNAGVEGAETMIVELKAYVNKDGRIKDVRILNMKSDPVFRSMAESARRAIHVCDGLGDESPFKILSTKHPENYSSWKEIHLRMNPVSGGVF